MDRKKALEHHVKAALSEFYDTARLETSPLAQLLSLAPAPGESVAHCLRRTLRQALQRLRPARSVPYNAPEWAAYRVLWTHYIQRQSQVETCRELGMSRATFYRHRGRAIEAVAALLAEGVGAGAHPTAPSAFKLGTGAGSAAAQEAARLARNTPRQTVNLGDLLQSVRQTLVPLAASRDVSFSVRAPSALPPAHADPGLLRQMVVALVMSCVATTGGGPLELVVRCGDDESLWALHGLAPDLAPEHLADDPGYGVGAALLAAYGGRIDLLSADGVLRFALPGGSCPTVLILDDDIDLTRLYGVYLRERGYAIRVAANHEELQEQLAQAIPDLIVLDVLMPRWDGWSILQQLRAETETAKVPIVICSVLPQADLALSLGADRVLQKPVSRGQLVETVHELLAAANSPH